MPPISESVISADSRGATSDRTTDGARTGAARRLCSPSRALFLVGVDRRPDAGIRGPSAVDHGRAGIVADPVGNGPDPGDRDA